MPKRSNIKWAEIQALCFGGFYLSRNPATRRVALFGPNGEVMATCTRDAMLVLRLCK